MDQPQAACVSTQPGPGRDVQLPAGGEGGADGGRAGEGGGPGRHQPAVRAAGQAVDGDREGQGAVLSSACRCVSVRGDCSSPHSLLVCQCLW